MPAASAVLLCAATIVSKNRSPWSAGRPCAPARRSVFPPSAVCLRRGRRCRGLVAALAASGAAGWIDLKGPAYLSCRGTLIEPLHGRQLELLRKSASRQTHHSSSVHWILSLNSLSHFWGQAQRLVGALRSKPAGGGILVLGDAEAQAWHDRPVATTARGDNS